MLLKRSLILQLVMVSMTVVNAAPQSRGPQVRIKDITQLSGEHPNQLTGYGLVTGLAGTGGTSESTKRLAINLLQKLGLRANPQVRELIQQAREKTDNISVVMVTATLPPHAKKGQRVDVVVSAFDDAESLNGGILISTPLTGVDGEVYALAGGSVSINGGNFGGQAASVVKNHPTSGRIAGGAVIEDEVPSTIFKQGVFHLLLRHPEYETARRITEAINGLSPGCAAVIDPAMVAVQVPYEDALAPFDFVARCQELTVTPDILAKVVINERTGTIVFSENVRLSSVAITHGNLIVSTIESPEISQPGAFSEGQTAAVPRTSVDVVEQGTSVNVIDQTGTVADLAASLNALGVSPRDLSSIFQMLKESGALHAELEIK
jgi:flagellar P-ring protein precursor FlgI